MLNLYPYRLYEHQLPEELCKGIVSISKAEFEKADVYKEGKDVEDSSYRNNKIKWFNNPEIIEILSMYAEKANVEANWFFNVDSHEIPQVSSYGQGEFYDWHIDMGVEKDDDISFRKITVAVNLNDDYEGGEFQIEKWCAPNVRHRHQTLLKAKGIGSVLVFPSFLHHRVKAVTEGNRYSLVCWFRGSRFS